MLAGHVDALTRDTPVPPPGAPDTFRQRFWSDGTARLTAYEYLGLTQSPCFRGGRFTCTSCHTMHAGDAAGQLAPERLGDRACTQCHAEIARDVGAHTHHAPASSGSRCVECHMPRIVYGVLDIHRSHRIEVARRRARRRGRPAGRVHRLPRRPQTPRGPPIGCATCGARATAARPPAPTAPRWSSRRRWPRCTRAIRCSGPSTWPRSAAPTAACRRARAGSCSPNALVGLGDAYGAVRFLARRSALALDRSLGLGLERELAAYDVQAGRDVRDPALQALLQRFAAAARERLPPPPGDAFVSRDYRWTWIASDRCWDGSADHVISVGE